MARFIKKKKQEIGLSPDDLLFRGKQKINEVILRIIDFDENTLEEDALRIVKDVLKYTEKDTVTWLNVDGLHNAAVMKEIADTFDLDTLVLCKAMLVSQQAYTLHAGLCSTGGRSWRTNRTCPDDLGTI